MASIDIPFGPPQYSPVAFCYQRGWRNVTHLL
jgi:hypothetical protein